MANRDELMRHAAKWKKAVSVVSLFPETEEHVQCAPTSVYGLRGTTEAHKYICIKHIQKIPLRNCLRN